MQQRAAGGHGARAAVAARLALLVLPVALAGWLATEDGGFLPGATATAALVALGGLLVWVMTASQPVAGLTRLGLIAVGGFAIFAAWTLASAVWSGAPARALAEFDRALLYLAAFLLVASLPGGVANARVLLRCVAVALAAVALAGLLSRLYPGLSEAASARATDRLGWPLGYWNALGLAAAMATVAALHLAADLRERAFVRVLAAAAIPALAVTLYLTLSRGALVAGAAGLAVLLLGGFSRGMVTALVATLPFTAWAVATAYGAEALVDSVAGDTASAREGRALSGTVIAAAAGAAAARALGLLADARATRLRLWRPWSGARKTVFVAVLAAFVVGAGAAAGGGNLLSEQWESFTASDSVEVSDARDRLAEASANGRIEHWRVAWEAWRGAPVTGHGAGEYAKLWARERELVFTVQDAHSLWLEVLAELGVVGLSALLVALLVPLVALLRRRGEDRLAWTAVLAICACWLVRAGADWDWEMPALTLPVIALLAAACSRNTPRQAGRYARARTLRLIAGLAILLLMVTPGRMAMAYAHLEDALASFREDRCAASIESSLAAIETLSSLPAPFELLGYCDARTGSSALGERMLRAAVRRDPGAWDLHYGLALVRGSAGRDPRPALRRALELNPMEPLLLEAERRLDTPRRRDWIRESRGLPLVIPGGDVNVPTQA